MSAGPIVIAIHPAAPPKPAEGAACNGCGVCCLIEPCPVGMLVSRKRRGQCAALVWSEDDLRYRCGMVTAPQQHLPRWLTSRSLLTRAVSRWSLRFIAAGAGCDCSAEPQ